MANTYVAVTLDSNNLVPTVLLGTGTASNSTYLRGDQTWEYIPLAYLQDVTSNVQAQLNGKQATLTAGQLPGTATNDSASAGNVGEVIRVDNESGGPISLNTSSATTLLSISLTAGDWDISGAIAFMGDSSSTVIERGILAISKTTNNLGGGDYAIPVSGEFRLANHGPNVPNATHLSIPCPTYQIKLSAPTTFYLIGYSVFSGGGLHAQGYIEARRMR